MVIPLLYFPFKSNLSGQKGDGTVVTATGVGAIRYMDGGVMCEEGTTNLFPNPIAGVNTTGMTISAGRTITRETAAPPLDAAGGITTAFRMNTSTDYPTGVSDAGTANDMTHTAVAHTVSAYVWIPSSWTGGVIGIGRINFTGLGGAANADCNMALRDQWQRVSQTYTPLAGDVVGAFRFGIDGTGTGWAIGEYFLATSIQVEAKGYATTPCPLYIGGALQTGYTWSGTAHASSSVRANSYLTTTATAGLPRERGSFILLMRTNRWVNGVRHVWWGGGAISVSENGIVGRYQVIVNGPVYSRNNFSPAYDDKIIYVEWDETSYRALDGLNVLAGAPTNVFAPNAWPGGTSLILGNDGGTGARTMNGPVQGFAYFPRPLTGDERSFYVAQMQAGAIDFTVLSPRYKSMVRASATQDISIVQEGRFA